MMTRGRTARHALAAGCSLLALNVHYAFADPPPAPTPAPPPVTNLGAVGTTETGETEVAPSATGDRAQAKEMKEQAPNVIEVQPYTEIEKLPDVSIAEALQRVPGISMESDSGEGRFINIRGMDADLNGTTFDGVRLTPSNQSSPLGGSRAVAFDAFPSGAIGGIEVIKTLTPDIDAEGLGGVINLLPRTLPADGRPFVDASLGYGFEPLRSTGVYKGDITVGTSFGLSDSTAPWNPDANSGGDRPFTIIATFARYDDSRGIDDEEEDYSDSPPLPNKTLSDLQMRWYEYHRSRQGGGGEIDYKPDPNNTFYIRALDSGYEERADKHYLVLHGLDGTNDGGTFATLPDGSFAVTNANATTQKTNTDEKIENMVYVAGGHSLIADTVKLDYRVSWTGGFDAMPDTAWGIQFDGPTIPNLVYNNTNPAAITWRSPGVNLANPALYTLSPGNVQNSPFQSSDREWAGAIDATIPVPLMSYDGQVKLGFSARFRIRSDNSDQITYSPVGTVSEATLAEGPDSVYYTGLYNIGPNISPAAFSKVKLFASDPLDDMISNQEAFQHDSENVYAGYGMYTVAIGQLGLIGGVRVEATDARYAANVGTTQPDGTTLITPTTSSTSYTNAFPSFQAKYTLADDLIARAAISTAIARPGFNQITAAKTIDYTQFTVSEGNPGLKPTTSLNFDATIEYYLPKGGIATFGLFDKELDNYIVPTTLFLNNFNNSGNVFMLNSFKNIGGAEAQGIELGYTQQFTFLPQPFDGLGFDGNYTYNHSRGQIRPGEFEPLPSTSPQNFNAALFYEEAPWTLRIASSFVSRNVFSVGSTRDTDIFSSPRMRVDFQGSYDVTDHITLSFDAKNLTNTPLEFTESEVASRPIQREFYDQTYLFSIRARY
ncbi:MAG TPA: TonB-dependent receptor, partial [Stellaceae bacterium]|nr:TonB-dependent receptor [Stellaceae bacterium]